MPACACWMGTAAAYYTYERHQSSAARLLHHMLLCCALAALCKAAPAFVTALSTRHSASRSARALLSAASTASISIAPASRACSASSCEVRKPPSRLLIYSSNSTPSTLAMRLQINGGAARTVIAAAAAAHCVHYILCCSTCASWVPTPMALAEVVPRNARPGCPVMDGEQRCWLQRKQQMAGTTQYEARQELYQPAGQLRVGGVVVL